MAEDLSHTPQTLRALRDLLSLDGPVSVSTISTLLDAQAKLTNPERDMEREGGMFVYDASAPNHILTVRQAFEISTNRLLTRGPVCYFDVPALNHDLGRLATLQELNDAVLSRTNPMLSQPSTNKPFPLVRVDKKAPHQKMSDFTARKQIEALQAAHNGNYGWSIIYGPTQQIAQYTNALDQFIFHFIEPMGLYDKLKVFISQADVERVNSSYGSPWIQKLSYTQLRNLNPLGIEHLITTFVKALQDDNPTVRVLVSDFGTGKSTLVSRLSQEAKKQGVFGMGVIQAQNSLREQSDAQRRDVVIVDEAVRLTSAELRELASAANQEGRVLVLMYPKEQAIPKDLRHIPYSLHIHQK